jgi:RimJ/RimL family protein N-acetyltransferase
VDVALRPVDDSDLDALFGLMRDPESVQMAAFTAKDPDDREAFDIHMSKVMAAAEVTLRAVLRGGRLVGSISCFVMDGDTEITYWIDHSVWGQGVASQALALFLEEVPVRPLHARAASDNVGSLRVLKRAGFTIIGTEVSSQMRGAPKSRKPFCASVSHRLVLRQARKGPFPPASAQPGSQQAEFVAFRVGQDLPGLLAGLADVGRARPELQQTFEFGVLIAVGGVDVEVQPHPAHLRLGTGDEVQSRLQSAEPFLRSDLHHTVVSGVEHDEVQHLTPERRQPLRIPALDHQLGNATSHDRHPTGRQPHAASPLPGQGPQRGLPREMTFLWFSQRKVTMRCMASQRPSPGP